MVKVFVVLYDFNDMPCNTHTFLRQKIVSVKTDIDDQVTLSICYLLLAENCNYKDQRTAISLLSVFLSIGLLKYSSRAIRFSLNNFIHTLTKTSEALSSKLINCLLFHGMNACLTSLPS